MGTRRARTDGLCSCRQEMLSARSVLLQELVIARMSLESGHDDRCLSAIGSCLSTVKGIGAGGTL